jgi:hypothetical protein
MTTNQAVAMFFPLLTAAAVFVTGLFIRKPWAEKKRAAEFDPNEKIGDPSPGLIGIEGDEKIIARTHLEEAERLISSAQRELQRARLTASPN